MNSPPGTVGLTVRLAALLYDALVLACVWFFAATLAVALNGGQALPPQHPLLSLYLLLVSFGFVGWFWTHGGQTLGMKAWKIRLVETGGGPVGWKAALIRYLLALLSLACLGLGYLWVIVEPQKRSWHDLGSNTRVVRADSTGP